MQHGIAGSLLLALATAGLGPGRAGAQGLSFAQFSDWNFAHESGGRALREGDLVAASRRFRNAIEIAWPVAATDPRPLARTYTDFALVLLQQGRAREAEPLVQWALRVREERFGEDSTQAAATLHVLALLDSAQARYAQAEAALTRAIRIWERRLGPDHPQVAVGLNDLATLCSLQHKYERAEILFRRVVDMSIGDLPAGSPDRAIALIGLASAYAARGELERAESTDQQLVALLEKMAPTAFRDVAASLERHLAQLRALGRTREAEVLEAGARAVRAGENRGGPRPGELRRRPMVSRPRST